MTKSDKRIPKIIHYCWFGRGPLSELAQKCIESWKRNCPDYELMLWNEVNFDVSPFPYAAQAYEAKRWAFVSDVARLFALKTYGGIYLDTDVEIVKPIDFILENDIVFGMEDEKHISTSLIAAQKDNSLIKKMLDSYEEIEFDPQITNVERFSQMVINSSEVTIYERDYFSPKDYETGVISVTDNTCAIHHFDQSWKTPMELERDRLFRKHKKILPEYPSWVISGAASSIKEKRGKKAK